MIYQLNNDHIDLQKVEMIGDIKEDSDYIDFRKEKNGYFYYGFQVNGVSYISDKNKDKLNLETERQDFLNAWGQYQKRKAIGYQV